MITETSAVAFRQNLGEMLNIVQYRHDSVLIKKDGKPVAALIDARLFERIRRMQERFDAMCDRLEQAYAGVTEDEALAEIEQASAQARHDTAAAWRTAGRLPSSPPPSPPASAHSSPKPAKRVAGTKGAKTPVKRKAAR